MYSNYTGCALESCSAIFSTIAFVFSGTSERELKQPRNPDLLDASDEGANRQQPRISRVLPPFDCTDSDHLHSLSPIVCQTDYGQPLGPARLCGQATCHTVQ